MKSPTPGELRNARAPIASLISKSAKAQSKLAPGTWPAALAGMIDRVEKAEARYAPGTAQHTLQRNRLKALRVAEAVTLAKLAERDNRPVGKKARP